MLNPQKNPKMIKGAYFSKNNHHRFALWRIWNPQLPKITFIGFNPSKADEKEDDATIRRVIKFAKSWGYGGVYMVNCYSIISTNPYIINDHYIKNQLTIDDIRANQFFIELCTSKSNEVVFAWGTFKAVKQSFVEEYLIDKFPLAKCLLKNIDGSPRHPLYIRADKELELFNENNLLLTGRNYGL